MRILYISAVFILFFTNAFAQQKEYSGQMHVTPSVLEQKGDSLYIKINFDISGVNVDSRRSISLIPTLVSSSNRMALPEVMVKGHGNYHIYQREMSLMSKRSKKLYDQKAPYAVLKGFNAKDSKSVLYDKVIKYEPWMADAHLDMYEDLCGCGNAPRRMGVTMLANQVALEKVIIIEPYSIMPRLAYVRPAVETVKRRELTGEAFLDFAVGKVDIRPDYMNNPRELKKITDMVSEVRNDKDITVLAIKVIGYASPEGTLAHNQWLSENRAKALVDYLLPRFDFSRDLYKVVFGGENWSGLREMVESSSIYHKDRLLSILDDRTILDAQRKVRLKTLAGGEPYRFMLKEWYPSLRKAICKVEFDVKNFDISQAKEIVKVRPQNLSLNEMFLVANTYDKGSQEFIDLFETAVRIYPDDSTANLNAAAAALSRGDIVYAKRYLDRVNNLLDASEYHNTLGVMEMLGGNYDKAEEYLNKAVRMGSNEARENLSEIAKKRENILQIEEQKAKKK